MSSGHELRLAKLMKNWNNDPPITSYNAYNAAIRRYRRYRRYGGTCHIPNPHPHLLRAPENLTLLPLNIYEYHATLIRFTSAYKAAPL